MTQLQRNQEEIYWVRDNLIASDFPPVNKALDDPDGLLAIGGKLSTWRLIEAYRQGIFPWYNEGQPILWWSPDPRWVLAPDEIRISRSLRKTLRKGLFKVTINQDFPAVITKCAVTRKDSAGTWITPELRKAFTLLHKEGYAHSVETWYEDELVGGLYGVVIGRVFFGESMFSKKSDASKVALVYLCRLLNREDFSLIDCQVHTSHLESMGAAPMSRSAFVDILKRECDPFVDPAMTQHWRGLLQP